MAADITSIAPEVLAEVDGLIAAGKKIEAIRTLRIHTGWGLKEAKDMADSRSMDLRRPVVALEAIDRRLAELEAERTGLLARRELIVGPKTEES